MTIQSKKLSSFCRTGSGGTPSRSNSKFFENGTIPWVKSGELKNRYITRVEEYITELAVEKSSAKLVSKGSLLIAMYGATVGEVSQLTFDATTNQAICNISPDENICDVNYLYRFLEASKPYLLSRRVGGGQPNISQGIIKDLEVPLPPLLEQRRIASILDKADELRQKRQQAIEKLDQLLQATFIDMFGDPVSNPKGWDKEKMDTLMTIVRGGSPRPIENFLGGTYPWIKIGDATKGDELFITKTKEAITEEGLHKTRLLPEGSVIFANCGVSLGFARILKIQGCIHDGWLAFQDINEEKIHKLFLLKALNSITQYFRDTAPDGTQPNLNTGIMKSFELIIPPMDLQLKFIKVVELIEKQKKMLETSNAEVSKLFKSLQNQAFSGNL